MANFFKCLRCTCCGNSLLSLPSRQLHTTAAVHIPATWCFGSMAKRSTPRFTASWAASRCVRRKAWPQKLYTQGYFLPGTHVEYMVQTRHHEYSDLALAQQKDNEDIFRTGSAILRAWT